MARDYGLCKKKDLQLRWLSKMCEWSKWGDTRIDPCMRPVIKILNECGAFTTLSCCCGHGKYPMTVVVRGKLSGKIYELFSMMTEIPRKKRFYKRDEEGHYYIPEVVKFYERR